MATLSTTDKTKLNAEQQAQVAEYKKQYAAAKAAGDQAGMDAAHKGAEGVRASAGYSGGSTGSSYSKLPANAGGQTADQVRQWVEDYDATNYDPKKGWVNGYSVDMNTRSKANYIRQQMDANSKAWHDPNADKDYLHQQNVELAKILADYTGQSEKNYSYDPSTGKWYTWNTNVGYGADLNWTQPNVANAWKQYYGYTDEDRNRWDNDTSHYYNFVDTRVANRNAMDESSGYTGAYSQFINGPYASLMSRGSRNVNPREYTDNYNDGWGLGENGYGGDVRYDSEGNVIQMAPEVRNNTGLSDYSRLRAAYINNGVIQPNVLTLNTPRAGQTGAYSGKDPDVGYLTDTDRYLDAAASTFTPGTTNYHETKANPASEGQLTDNLFSQIAMGSGSGGSYIDQMYNALLQSQLEQLRASYAQNVSDLDASQEKTDRTYTEQKRQADGQAAQNAANWREMAAAYGLNSGAVGQAALAMNNQNQSDLNALNSAQAAEQAELERQRYLLAQQYQSQINQAIAENDYNKANALYQEAVRQEEQLLQQQQLLMQQQQFNANLQLQYAQLAASQQGKTKATGDLQINPGVGDNPSADLEPTPNEDTGIANQSYYPDDGERRVIVPGFGALTIDKLLDWEDIGAILRQYNPTTNNYVFVPNPNYKK